MRTVTFEIDQAKLFDMLSTCGGDFSDLGNRVVGALLAETGFIDAIGMAVYGVVVVDAAHIERIEALNAAYATALRNILDAVGTEEGEGEYRADDREGCFDYVEAIARAALASATLTDASLGKEIG